MKSAVRRLLLVSLLITCVVGTWQCNMIVYGIEQGVGQMKVVCKARPVDKVMKDDSFPDSLKSKLVLIQEIRDFAIDSLGINDSKNYKTVYDQQGEPVLWVVSGCPPFELESYKWDYPFLGELGYKGFFDLKKAEEEERRLKSLGLDTDLDEVGAWSTLGWFNDPILSGMLNRSEGGLARLIIHELTHATLYVKGDADYNENLATFVGDNGAKLFLIHKYGENSKEYLSYIGHLRDIEKFSEHILKGALRLDSLYASFGQDQSKELMQQKKESMIRKVLSDADTISFYDPSRFRHLTKNDFLPNNTFFMNFKMYRAEQNAFEKEFREEFGSDFRRYLTYLKEQYDNS